MDNRQPFRFSILNLMLLMLPVALLGWAAGSGRVFRGAEVGWAIVIPSICVPPMYFGQRYGRQGVYQGLIVGALIGCGYVVLLMFVFIWSR